MTSPGLAPEPVIGLKKKAVDIFTHFYCVPVKKDKPQDSHITVVYHAGFPHPPGLLDCDSSVSVLDLKRVMVYTEIHQ